MENADFYNRFMTNLSADSRVRKLANRGVIPADLAGRGAEEVILILAMRLVELHTQIESMPLALTHRSTALEERDSRDFVGAFRG